MPMETARASEKMTTTIWVGRFWERIKDHTGMSIQDVLSVVPLNDVEQWIQGWERDPEGAADAQIDKWRKKYAVVDQAFRDTFGDRSSAIRLYTRV